MKSKFYYRWLGIGLLIFGFSTPKISHAQSPVPPPATPAPALIPSAWYVVKQKTFPFYKVEIQQRTIATKPPRVDSMKANIIPLNGSTPTEYVGMWMTPDPRDYLVDWNHAPIDVDGDGIEDLVLRNFSGGGHCCFNYVIYSLTPNLKKLGDLDMEDCGQKIRLNDLDGDQKKEILTCDSRFTYLGDLPYSESPFPPAVYRLETGGYQRADQSFKSVYEEDIRQQRLNLSKGYRPAVALQIVLDYLLMGNESQAWKELDTIYQGTDKNKIKLQMMDKLGLKAPEPEKVDRDADIDAPKKGVPDLPAWFKN